MLSERLRKGVEDIFGEIVRHPFLVELQNGSLDREKFLFYLRQDHYYLQEYSRTLLITGVCSGNQEVEEMFARHATDAIKTEKMMHEDYFRRFGRRLEDFALSPWSEAYVNFLVYFRERRDFRDLLIAVAPCYVIYRDVGRVLYKGMRESEYSEWIEKYGHSEQFEKSVEELEGVIDSTSGIDEERAMKIYRKASMFEYKFWDTSYRMETYPFGINGLI
ncbi:aminopyrimidine aminohydrolase [Thermogymnomonas acidicola]|uniref:Aminopyrimidine aminohydrolase n=1 Tax=Thermogymnomonas acidicola TaxID=399579 RepID=A0AA37F9X0_9ARCH|nr:TenA family protein [Thermogymnomonas acidicola]GGM76906.1 aminopyrimidine aminohydrolase [Thermogymnomonas acidicola]